MESHLDILSYPAWLPVAHLQDQASPVGPGLSASHGPLKYLVHLKWSR